MSAQLHQKFATGIDISSRALEGRVRKFMRTYQVSYKDWGGYFMPPEDWGGDFMQLR